MVPLVKENNNIQFVERKGTDIQYHVQDNAAVELKYVKMYCKKNQFQELSFSGPHSKPNGARELSKHYHLSFDPKLGMVVCAISVHHLFVLLVHPCNTNLGYMIYHHITRSAINLSPSALIGQY